MCKVLELNGKTEILSFYSVILMFKPHFPAFPFCFGYYLTKFVPRLFLESDIALIFSSGKQFLDNSFCPLKTDKSLFSHKFNGFFTSHVFNIKSENKHVRQTFF